VFFAISVVKSFVTLPEHRFKHLVFADIESTGAFPALYLMCQQIVFQNGKSFHQRRTGPARRTSSSGSSGSVSRHSRSSGRSATRPYAGNTVCRPSSGRRRHTVCAATGRKASPGCAVLIAHTTSSYLFPARVSSAARHAARNAPCSWASIFVPTCCVNCPTGSLSSRYPGVCGCISSLQTFGEYANWNPWKRLRGTMYRAAKLPADGYGNLESTPNRTASGQDAIL
jgi:hypothetical protein